MCGIAGIFQINHNEYSNLGHHLEVMNQLQAHRGPDGEGFWQHSNQFVGFAHRRLSIIDLETGKQPITDDAKNTICYNGEIYNYIELREELKSSYNFKTTSDTEVILAAYLKWGADCVLHLRGMFAFVIWDERQQRLFCARDRFGIKPFYYAIVNDTFYFASEAKSLVPFLPEIEVDTDALKDYLVFQLYLYGKTLFKGINELLRSHRIVIENGNITKECYWEVYYDLDWEHTPKYFSDQLQELIEESIKYHLRSDVPVGAYVSGGIDSGIIASVAARMQQGTIFKAFTGKFELGELYDESHYARSLANMRQMDLHEVSITHTDFIDSIEKVIYHLDYPVAGPGSFPQYHVSKLAANHCKVVLGGQGGDEIFGGYTRYLVAYFEQCIKGAIDGTLNNGNFVVTYESIIPNLISLQNYKPLLKDFWREGLFESIDKRYYQLINRAPSLKNEIKWEALGNYQPFEKFSKIFNGDNVGKESYFDKMTHFDFKTLLPGLLQVEDRMSMAHSLESRVPFLDHKIVEFAAKMPSNVKFKDGTLKMILLNTMKHELPKDIVDRKSKMGFPVPLNEWLKKEIKDFVYDVFNTAKNKNRHYFNHEAILNGLDGESQFGRKIWGLLSLEIWYQQYYDKATYFKSLLNQKSKTNIEPLNK
ncbi:MAG: asparagine synthase (glutamine-hydrolyzing) [Cytophagales bacterium]|nr:MAG: asparagine synthase (glutamine-hydrolyzing) [Cytophagales bacterium]